MPSSNLLRKLHIGKSNNNAKNNTTSEITVNSLGNIESMDQYNQYQSPQSQPQQLNPLPGQAQGFSLDQTQNLATGQQLTAEQQRVDDAIKRSLLPERSTVSKGKYSLADFRILRTLGTGSFGRVQITEKLNLHSLRQRPWYIQSTCATTGDGLYEGLEWLSNSLKNAP